MSELQKAYLYSLAHLSHLGPRTALKLRAVFPTYSVWSEVDGGNQRRKLEEAIGPKYSSLLSVSWDALLEKAIADIRRHENEQIRVICIDDDDYPPLLRAIADPPLILFMKGHIDVLKECLTVAIVGTRDSTPAGNTVAFRIARFFGHNTCAIVSGLAKGIDTAAHKGTLDAKGRTVAVFGTPLNKIYPAENKALAGEILDTGGAWVSEIPLFKGTHRNSFVQRDRIQSGLSVAVIPVQTDVEGGTMHTVQFATEQNRLLFCPRPLSGEQGLKQYGGINVLINDGRAIPFQVDDYSFVLNRIRSHKEQLRSLLSTPANQLLRETSPPARGKIDEQKELRFEDREVPMNHSEEEQIQRLVTVFKTLGFDNSQSTFEEAVSLVRRRLFSQDNNN